MRLVRCVEDNRSELRRLRARFIDVLIDECRFPSDPETDARLLGSLDARVIAFGADDHHEVGGFDLAIHPFRPTFARRRRPLIEDAIDPAFVHQAFGETPHARRVIFGVVAVTDEDADRIVVHGPPRQKRLSHGARRRDKRRDGRAVAIGGDRDEAARSDERPRWRLD